LEKITSGSKEKKGLKNKPAEGDPRVVKDFIARLLGFISTTS